MKRKRDGINNSTEVAQASMLVTLAIALVVGAFIGYMFFNGKEIDDITPVEFESLTVESLTVEKEDDFIIKLNINSSDDTDVTSVVINGTSYPVKKIKLTDTEFYQVILNSGNVSGNIQFQLEEIKFNQDGKAETYLIPSDLRAEARVLMNLTDNLPIYVGVTVPDTLEKGTALPVTVQFDDVEGITELVINNLRYYADTDFTVTDNDNEVTVNIVGFNSLDIFNITINEYKYTLDNTVITTSLSNNNQASFQVVTPEPKLVDVLGSQTATVADVQAGIVEVDMNLQFSDTSMIYSITINGNEILTSKANVFVIDEDTIIVNLPHTDETVGTHKYVVQSFKYFDSVEMKEVDLSTENDLAYTLNVT